MHMEWAKFCEVGISYMTNYSIEISATNEKLLFKVRSSCRKTAYIHEKHFQDRLHEKKNIFSI